MHFLFSRIVVHVVHLICFFQVCMIKNNNPLIIVAQHVAYGNDGRFFYSREAIPKSEGDFFSFRKAYVLKKKYFACMHRINYIGNRELVIENNLFI